MYTVGSCVLEQFIQMYTQREISVRITTNCYLFVTPGWRNGIGKQVRHTAIRFKLLHTFHKIVNLGEKQTVVSLPL